MSLSFQANIVVDLIDRGGPVMIPLLLTALVAVCVVVERIWWWARLGQRRRPRLLDEVFEALEKHQIDHARQLAEDHDDPLVRMVGRGLSHRTGSLTGALQVEAAQELQRAGRYLPVMDTMVTLAPLLGLLGTVTGIMASFAGMGGTELAIDQVTGGISEALISTAGGLAIAIAVLIPLNYFQTRLGRLQFDLENVATQVELLVLHPSVQLGGAAVNVPPPADRDAGAGDAGPEVPPPASRPPHPDHQPKAGGTAKSS